MEDCGLAAGASIGIGQSTSLEWRHTNFGRLLSNALARFESRVLETMMSKGHVEVNRNFMILLRNLEVQGMTAAELGRRVGMRKQPMCMIIAQCERLGLVVRNRDDRDRRGKIVKFSNTGLRCLIDFRSTLILAETEMAHELGILSTDMIGLVLKVYSDRDLYIDRGEASSRPTPSSAKHPARPTAGATRHWASTYEPSRTDRVVAAHLCRDIPASRSE